MPIRAENKIRYPKNWKAIAAAIRERAGDRCECDGLCGLHHHVMTDGQLDLRRNQVTPGVASMRCSAVNRKPHPVTGSMVVITVAHLDHTPENVGDENLKAMCQRCHNCYDMPTRRAGIAERRRATLGRDLFD